MILEYHRPSKIEDVMSLLARAEPHTILLGGGTTLERFSTQQIAVVDLQSVGLNTVQIQGNTLQLGATLTLQSLADTLKSEKLENLAGLQQAIAREATYNLRQVGTVAGALVTASGRSPFATAMLALDANLSLQPADSQSGDEQVALGDLMPLRLERLSHRLITLVTIPLNARLAYEYVARSPADIPIVCAAVAIWPSGRTRVALGGFGSSPVLAFDGTEAEGVEIAARAACSQAEDEWASAEYRQEMAGILVKRCANQLTEISTP
jgi:CO/xanthine dehydrogenase FAD-binding subunit